ncbi:MULTISPECIES: DUF1254 domain-containing protein [unclassified Streptomyces]|uniref:DUF1254 domain-containing protein n=1 Tax=unclassified Streptomyces TaxID=2593676 RepID=UPI002E784F39|nr:DUF1254 domain-containing protein [Streptomyces sp. JV176]MEE1800927.1 DUF1254 domain-containing protein [Streptomyces sp. JV176]
MSDLRALAAEAYVYGYPMVFNLDQADRFTHAGLGLVPPAPFNTLAHGTEPAGPWDSFPGVTDDTVHSVAQLDLSGGPLLLSVPDTADRYYVLRFVDAWTNNFAYVGRRATGTAAGSFLLTGPGWEGEVPAGTTRIACPTAVASLVGRWACAGPEDRAATTALQRATRLEPYAPGPGGERAAPLAGLPLSDPDVTDGTLMFFEKLRVRMAAFPPAPVDAAYQRRFAPLGLLAPSSPYRSPEPELADALREGFTEGSERVEYAATHAEGPEQNGWRLAYHAFDHNADFFGTGVLTGPEWTVTDRDAARLLRAAAARTDLWGGHGYEAAYAMIWNDADGEPLEGRHTYTLRFEQPPPVDAFWSLTMYDLPEYHLVGNPLDRYAIGDRTPGLRRAADGSLTLHLRTGRPESEEAAANWLPTPPGRFRPVLRLYQPRPALLDGGYVLPAIRRAT